MVIRAMAALSALLMTAPAARAQTPEQAPVLILHGATDRQVTPD